MKNTSTTQRAIGVSAISAGALGVAASVVGFATARPSTAPASTPASTPTKPSRGTKAPPSASKTGPSKAGTGATGTGKTGSPKRPKTGSPSRDREITAPSPDSSQKPDSPTDITPPSWKYVLKKTAREFGADKCTDLAAGLVYYSVLALFPALLAIVSILGIFGQAKATETVVFGLIGGASPAARTTIEPIITSLTSASGAGIILVIGILGAIWSASKYVGAFGRAMNRIYGIDEGRPIWKLRPTQLAVTAAVVVLVVIGALILVLSGGVASTIGSVIGLGPTVVFVWGIVKWPVLAGVAIVAVALLYYFTPNVKQPKFRWTSTGSILALVIWVLASALFAIYVLSFSNYNKTYGALGGVIVFLLWLWITNIALLFGAEWDAELERGRELQGGIAAEETIQLPPRDSRQSEKKAAKHEQDVAQGRRLRESRGGDS